MKKVVVRKVSFVVSPSKSVLLVGLELGAPLFTDVLYSYYTPC